MKNCRKILLKNPEKVLLTDHQTSVSFHPKNVPGKQYYYGKDCPIQCQIKEAETYYEKLLTWQCLDEEGNVSYPFVTTATVTGKDYLKECLKKKLIPSIGKHRKIKTYFGWT